MNYLRTVFGTYFNILGSNLLKKEYDPDTPHSGLVRTEKKRITVFSEIGKGSHISKEIMKAITGQDLIPGRDLYKGNKEILLIGSYDALCNDLPEFNDIGHAIWSRVMRIDYVTRFTKKKLERYGKVEDLIKSEILQKKNKERDYSYIYPVDNDLKNEETIIRLSEQLAVILVENLRNVNKTGLIEPDEVKASTKEYKNMNNIYVKFGDAHIQKVKDEDCKLLPDIAYSGFKQWYREKSYNLREMPDLQTFIIEFSNFYIDKSNISVDGNYWIGYKMNGL
jgi:phage/plasmid-associated DNA primase